MVFCQFSEGDILCYNITMKKRESAHAKAVGALSKDEWHELDRISALYDEQNKNGEQPRIADFLQSDILNRSLLLRELVLCDASFRYSQGHEPSVDDYRTEFPELEGDTVLLDELISLR